MSMNGWLLACYINNVSKTLSLDNVRERYVGTMHLSLLRFMQRLRHCKVLRCYLFIATGLFAIKVLSLYIVLLYYEERTTQVKSFSVRPHHKLCI